MNTKLSLVLLILILIVAGPLVNGPIAQAQEPGTEAGPPRYEDVIPPEAESDEGVFTVHRVGDAFYLEIPPDVLGQDVLWYAETTEMPVGFATFFGTGLNSRVVRFERRGNQILVRDLTVPLTQRTGSTSPANEQPTDHHKVDPVDMAVAEASLPPVMMVFEVITAGPDGSAVIDVTETFASNLADFDVQTRLALSEVAVLAPDPARSYIEEIKAFPRNIFVRSLLTFVTTPDPVLGDADALKGASVSVGVAPQPDPAAG